MARNHTNRRGLFSWNSYIVLVWSSYFHIFRNIVDKHEIHD